MPAGAVQARLQMLTRTALPVMTAPAALPAAHAVLAGLAVPGAQALGNDASQTVAKISAVRQG